MLRFTVRLGLSDFLGRSLSVALSGSSVTLPSSLLCFTIFQHWQSTRFPPAACGLYCLSVSAGRLPSYGCGTSVPGLEVIQLTSPIARSLDDLKEFWKRIICVSIPWRPVDFVLTGKPKWAVFWNDGLIAPTPACTRALQSAVQALKQQGYEVVNFDGPSAVEGLKIGYPLAFADGGLSTLFVHVD
ncbi:hypothetical protein PHLCEN_2v942 [Hermanssonia centrifuga]|uniref:Amidase domain-containing protein n=1 Tax=Hermanssonia centrifuga TaxID=98765 RepID=A0A2R6S4L3_9APHY|nr:hypothetical protein PHLCEN_2v942 [Hermanssonia centrifuga]